MSPFADWNCAPMYIVWRGSDKSPVDPLHPDPASDYARSNAHDRSTWLTWELATEYARALGAGYGVGLVLHDGAGLYCLDLDNCIVGGKFSDIAKKIIGQFRDVPAYIEISMSGRGVHIIAPYVGEAPPHSTKNHTHKMELYHTARYIALTGNRIDCDDPRLN